MNLEMLRSNLPHRLIRIAHEIVAAGGHCYLVGGWVRDALLGKESRDFDIEVYALEQDSLMDILCRHGKPNLVGKSYGVINLISKGQHFDFSFPRLESKIGPGHRAFAVETRSDLDFATAALRRDFTFNAMGMELPSLALVDPYGGQQDLQARILRHVGPAFVEDPLRVLRGVQFAARFCCTVDPATVSLCRSLDLRELSRERLYEEFRKWLLKGGRPSYGLSAYVAMDLARFFPWLQAERIDPDFLDAAANVREGDELDQAVLLFAVLCSGCADRNAVQTFLEALTNEVKLLRQVPSLWEDGPRLAHAILSGEAFHAPWLRRLSLRVPLPQAVRWVRALWMSRGTELRPLQELEDFARLLGVWEAPPEPLLTGKMLMSLGLKPGRFFGTWIAESFELQIEGNLQTPEDALAWAQERIAQTSLGD